MKPYTLAEAEAEARAAIDAGDAETLTRLEAIIDQLEPASQAVNLASAALWYGQQGIAIFPLIPGMKAPLHACPRCRRGADPRCTDPKECGHDHCHGVLDATTDAERITHWWTENPQANIGISTGRAFDVVDIDGATGQAARAEHWCYEQGCRDAAEAPQSHPGWTPHCDHPGVFNQIDADAIAKVITPRPGGMHIYVPPTGGGNGANVAKLKGIDYRGAGGYVVAPPSRIMPGGKDYPGQYRFLGIPDLNAAKAVA